MLADDLGGGKTVEGNLCGPHGTNSCLPEGDASDWTSWSPANKHPEVVVAPVALLGCLALCPEGAAAEALYGLTARFGARRALIAAAMIGGAEEGDQAFGPADVGGRSRVAQQVYFAAKQLARLVQLPQPSLITINRWLRSIWPRGR